MGATSEYTAKAQDQVLAGLRQGQDALVKAVETWANAVGKLPTPRLAVPFSEELPNPEEILETTFELAQKLLDAQHEFARNLLRAAAPALPGSAADSE